MKKASLIICLLLTLLSCTRQQLENAYSTQEDNIDKYATSLMSKDPTSYAVYNSGSVRVVVNDNIGKGVGDSLATNGVVSFRYAGYVFKNSISASALFATNKQDEAEKAGWSITDESAYDILTVKLGEDDLLDGLRHGLVGVKAGQESYILFSGKYGYGNMSSGTIPAKSALAYHIWVESISNE